MKNQRKKSKEIILAIDTASSEKVVVVLRANEREFRVERKIDQRKAQAVLPIIDSLLKKYKISLLSIQSIQVNTGPGSFTGLKVGVAIANALSFALKIPVNDKPVEEFVEPAYE